MLGNKTLGENAYINIKNLILNGTYEPGKRLQYDEVAKELGISNTPLKEAFLKLEREGFVEVIARKGTYVRKLTKADVIEAYQIREVLEGLSARLATQRATPEAIRRLKNNLKRLMESIKREDAHESIRLDIEFHEEIAKIANSKKLMHIFQHYMLTNIFAISGFQNLYLNIGRKAINSHQALINAVEEKNCEKAETVMREQMRDAAEHILRCLPQDAAAG